jgi:hypothetical protein
MPLSEEAFTVIADAGCTKCQSKKLVVESIVAQKMPILTGEPYGSPSWGYKGEDLVRGTYRIACEDCQTELFAATACSRCDAEGGVARALQQENAFLLPTSCLNCGSELLTAFAYVPAVVLYEGKRAAKARTQTAPEDEGFHAFRVECKQCGNHDEHRKPCPLCGSAGAGAS